jgi:hypothetical protein
MENKIYELVLKNLNNSTLKLKREDKERFFESYKISFVIGNYIIDINCQYPLSGSEEDYIGKIWLQFGGFKEFYPLGRVDDLKNLIELVRRKIDQHKQHTEKINLENDKKLLNELLDKNY